MPSKQIRDVLHHVRDAQQAIASEFQVFAANAKDQRVQFLLDYFARQEDQLTRILGSYEEELSEGLLETWLQFVDDDRLDSVARESRLPANADLEDVVDACLTFDEAVVALYTECAESTSAPEVVELFSGLVKLEDAARRQFARASRDI